MPKRKATVLVVDADPVHREAVRRTLRANGYRVLDATDYRHAINVHQQHEGQIHLLLTALSLPGGNGYELARAIRAVQPAIPVLFVSGQAGAKLSQFYGQPWGDQNHLARPFEPGELLERVRQLLESTTPFSAGASI